METAIWIIVWGCLVLYYINKFSKVPNGFKKKILKSTFYLFLYCAAIACFIKLTDSLNLFDLDGASAIPLGILIGLIAFVGFGLLLIKITDDLNFPERIEKILLPEIGPVFNQLNEEKLYSKKNLGEFLLNKTKELLATNKSGKIYSLYLLAEKYAPQILYDQYCLSLVQYFEEEDFSKKNIKIIERVCEQLTPSPEIVEIINSTVGLHDYADAVNGGEIPQVGSPPNGYSLKKNEEFYFAADAELYENVTDGFYLGGSIGLPQFLPKKLIGRPRVYIGKKINYQKMKRQDSGVLVVTNKHVTFVGDINTNSFDFKKIIGVETDGDALQIHYNKKSGKELYKLDYVHCQAAAVLIKKLAEEVN